MGGNEYVIGEDRAKLMCYTAGNLLLTLALMLISIGFFGMGYYLLAFFGVTGIWFSVKAMLRYGKKLVKNTPVCVFGSRELVIYSLPAPEVRMSYGEIKEIRMLRDWKSIKLFFASDKVTHPSGWNYVGIIYPFRRGELDGIETEVIRFLKGRHLSVKKTEKRRK